MPALARSTPPAMAAAVAIGLAAPTPVAAEYLALWQGAAVIRALEAGPCASAPTKPLAVGTTFRSLFRPRHLNFNGVDTTITFLAEDSTHQIRIVDGDFVGSGTFYSQTHTNQGQDTRNDGLSFLGAEVTPATVGKNTQHVTIVAAVEDFFATPGCNVIFEASLTRRYGP